jgi:hypothetical protein
MYGDPGVSWSILVDARVADPLDADEVQQRLTEFTDRFPHLGGPPEIRSIGDVAAAREEFASTPYDGHASLVRVGLADSTLLVAAHHGAVDGLGLLALVGAAVGYPVGSNARGLAGRPPTRSFALSAVQRVGEALFSPPDRFRPDGGAGSADVLLAAELPRTPVGSAALIAAASAALRSWNGAASARRIVAAVGASRRSGTDPGPEHRAAYLRFRLPADADASVVRDLLDRQAPEPDFPPSRNAVVRLGRRALANRLGSSFLASNLGVLRPGGPLRGLAFFPQPSGPAGVAFGAASTASTTTVTIRARRVDFSDDAAGRLLKHVVAALGAAGDGEERSHDVGR